MRTITPRLESLDDRQLLATGLTGSLVGAVLTINGGDGNNTVRISNAVNGAGQSVVRVQANGALTPDGATSLDITSPVNQIILSGGAGDDALLNLTNINSTISGDDGNDYLQAGTTLGVGGNDTLSGGDGDDILFDSGGTNALLGGNGTDTVWGFGNDMISGGVGDDTIYNIVGSGTIDGGIGNDRIITNARFSVVPDAQDRPTVVFQPRAQTVALDNGVLYFAGSSANDVATVSDNGDGTITTRYTDATGTRVDRFNKADVTQVASVLGAGNDIFVNGSSIDSVVYGAAGNDFLSGGSGNDVMKGGAGADAIFGNAGDDDITSDGAAGSPFADILNGGSGSNIVRARFGVGDALVFTHSGASDTVIGDTLVTFGTPKRRVG